MTATSLPPAPLPEPTGDSRPYWAGLREKRLRFQQCANCGKVRHYPRPLCDVCYTREVIWIAARGEGVVHSWTVAHHAFHPAFKADLPYALVTVDLVEGVRMVAPFRGDAAALCLGLPVAVIFEGRDSEVILPAFIATKDRCPRGQQ
ncbi:MAG: Zn-ribbon domain-containing OB-fold protein [Gammaproteobacteria bacterium]